MPPSVPPSPTASPSPPPAESPPAEQAVLLHVDLHNHDHALPAGVEVTAGATTETGVSSQPTLQPCPEETSSWLGFTYLTWLNDLFAIGGHRTLQESDIYAVRDDVAAKNISRRFQQCWEVEKARYDQEENDLALKASVADNAADGADGALRPANKKTNLNFSTTDTITFASYRLLFRTINAMYGRRFWVAGLLKCCYDATAFTQPMLLALFVTHIQDSQDEDPSVHPPKWHGYAIAAGMFAVCLVGITFLNLFQRIVVGVGLRSRTALITALYRKSFRLSPAARAQMSTGQIVNMMSVDTTMVDLACNWFHYGWTAAVQMIVAIVLLIRALGVAALVGMGIVLIFVPVQAMVMKGLRIARRSALKYTDQRIRMLSEILQGIRVIKVYAWENSFIKQLTDLRQLEMKWVKNAAYIRGRNACITMLGPIIMALGTFMTLGAMGKDLRASSVFSSVVLFNLLRMPLAQLPNVMNMVADAQIGLNRIQKFLLAEELSDLPERLTSEQADAESQRDREMRGEGNGDLALRAAYESLLAASPTDRFAIKIAAAEFSWDVLPGQIVKDDPAELAAATSGGRGGRGGGRGGGGAGRGGRGGKGLASSSSSASSRGGSSAARGGRGGKAGEQRNLLLSGVSSGGDSDSPPKVVIDDAAKIAPSALLDITLLIPAHKLTIVCGSVGSGKSSLLSGLLGEMKRKSGSVSIAGTVGYCAQQAWIQNQSVRNNITFGRPYDEKRYQETIRVCALTRDLKVLPDGDLTEIGEKGINLSGGQKQRVNLARAYYFNSDIILMDDPLSAVDAHVSKYLFSECIQGAMAGKTRVLVTHQLQYIPQADHVIFLKEGRVLEVGNYETLMKRDGEFAQLFRTHGGGDNTTEEEKDLEGSDDGALVVAAAGTEKKQEQAEEVAGSAAAKPKDPNAPRTLMTTEERAQGGLKWQTWWYYLKAFGGTFWVTVILISVALQMGIRTFNDFWLSSWSDDSYNKSTNFYIAIYGSLGVGLCLALLLNVMLQVHRGCLAAHIIHDRCFASLLAAPMSFFDTTPIGRVLNRFSRDQDAIDNSLSDSLRMLSFLFATILGVLVMMCYVQPWFCLALVPIMCLYYYFQNIYRRVNREVKRMDSTSRSPLFAHFSETLTGLPTIRAYGQQQPFIDINAERMDENNRFYFVVQASQRWLGTRLETLGGLITFFTAIIAAANSTAIEAGLIGLSLSYALQVTNSLSFFLRQSVESENYMNSVERSKFYTEGINQEAPPVLPTDNAPEVATGVWPSHGDITFENVSLRYREGLKQVLHGVSFNIKGGQRIGIVGRTGAGKSSLMVALFRLVEVSGGRILLDGQDIARLGLDKVRRSMAIIPQDPVLFSGTVRTNLDPFAQYSDDEIWVVLKKAHLYEHIRALDGQLQGVVSENGDNFSVGQKCMICLARAMLRNAKVLIMDEATASIDVETDSLIQQSLRDNFRECTILTIAHRLATIMDYDQCMVLDFGQIKEYDTPANLLRLDGGIFAGLVNETGPQTSELLRNISFDAERALAAGVGVSSFGVDSGAWKELSVSGGRAPRRVGNDAASLDEVDLADEEADIVHALERSVVAWHVDSENENDEGDSPSPASSASPDDDAPSDAHYVQID